MVYHEIRIKDKKQYNYLIYNRREDNKWVKKSKFIGIGKLSEDKILKLKENFEQQLVFEKNYEYLTAKQVVEIERLRKLYADNLRKLGKEEFDIFEHSFFTELTYNSNAIEGSSLSMEDTALILDEGLVPEGKTLREVYEAKNHARALAFINNYKKDIDELFILKIHAIILKDISSNFAGRYRESKVKIFGSDVNFPEAMLVPQLVKNLVFWYKKNKRILHPFELAAIFSMKFVTIHPFVDGNGRMSRLLMNLILKRNSYPWINIYNKQRREYLKAVRKANDEAYSEIIYILINTLRENLDSFGFSR